MLRLLGSILAIPLVALLAGCASTDARVGLSTNEGPRENPYNSLTSR